MEIGSLVTYQGRAYYLRGLDPMSVSDRQAELEDVFTHERVSVPLDEVADPHASPEREEWMLSYLLRANRGPLSAEGLRELFTEILDLTKREVGRSQAP